MLIAVCIALLPPEASSQLYASLEYLRNLPLVGAGTSSKSSSLCGLVRKNAFRLVTVVDRSEPHSVVPSDL